MNSEMVKWGWKHRGNYGTEARYLLEVEDGIVSVKKKTRGAVWQGWRWSTAGEVIQKQTQFAYNHEIIQQ